MPSNIKKVVVILFIAVVILFAAYVVLKIIKPVQLNNPESIVYDSAAKRFLVSNTGSGRILSMDDKGKLSSFLKKKLDNPRGMKLIDNSLFVAENTTISVIDLKKAIVTGSIPVTGAKMLNDIESDRQGLLYVTDTQADRLFIVDPATKKVESLKSDLMSAPNGIVYDYPRKQMLIVCLKKGSPILSYNVDSKQFSIFKSTLFDDLDGIAIDKLGRIYFSSWGEKTIYQIPQEQNRILPWQEEIPSPADIYYHKPTNELLVPVFEKNQIKRFTLD